MGMRSEIMNVDCQAIYRTCWSVFESARLERTLLALMLAQTCLLGADVEGCRTRMDHASNTYALGARQAKVAQESGIAISLPTGWTQMRLGSGYRGVGAFCDAGIIEVLIERLPFDEEVRTGDFDRQIVSSRRKEPRKTLGRFKGRGYLVSGLTADGDRMSYLLFYPDPPAERVAILVICGEADERQKVEAEAVVNSLREAQCR